MGWPDEAAEGLPAPRDDEPATLREDLVDELSDHLNCAMHRELRKHDAPEEAAKHVRKRFGDPRAVLRKLWFDAMKEKIMSQRVTIALVLVLACSSMAATAFAWVAVRDGREAATAMQQSNTALLEKMTELLAARPAASAAPAPAANSNWTHVKFQLVVDEPKGAPAVGYSIELRGNGGAAGDAWVGTKKSDATGEIDFGLVPAAPYVIQVVAPFREQPAGQPILIPPGEAFHKTILCPSRPIAKTDDSIEIENMAALGDKKAIIVCDFSATRRRLLGEWEWSDSLPAENTMFRAVFGTDGRLVHLNYYDKNLGGFFQDTFSPKKGQLLDLPWGLTEAGRGGLTIDGRLLKDLRSPQSSVSSRIWESEYQLVGMTVLPESSIPKLPDSVTSAVPAFGFQFVNTTPAQPTKPPYRFTPVAGEKRVWKIALPEIFVEQTREFIAANDQIKEYQIVPQDPLRRKRKDDYQLVAQEFLRHIGITKPKEITDPLYPVQLPMVIADGGIVIGEDVASGSAAEKAGIRKGDFLIGINAYQTTNLADLGWISRDVVANKSIKFLVWRKSKGLVSGELTVPDSWPPKADSPPEKKELAPADPSANRLESPNSPAGDKEQESLGQKFFAHLGITKTDAVSHGELEGSKYRGGIVLQEIKTDSVAAKAGLRQGDVLVGLHKYETTNLTHIGWITTHRPVNQPLKFHIVRNKQSLSGQLTIPDNWPPKAAVPAEKKDATSAEEKDAAPVK